MDQTLLASVQQTFESIKIQDETGFEFWSARDLMTQLWYKKRERFSLVVQKAKQNCSNSKWIVQEHFIDEQEFFQEAGKTKKEWRPRENYFLTRYACYLIALNADARLLEVSLAKTYFATQTRKQELQEQRIYEDKRLEARRRLKENEAKIEETIYQRWITQSVEFATFKNKWIEALYNLSVKALKQKRNIPKRRALADFDTEVELRAKDFVYAITDHNIKEQDLQGKEQLEEELVDNAKATRKTLIERWITPEQLPVQKDLKLIEKERKKYSLPNKTTKISKKNS